VPTAIVSLGTLARAGVVAEEKGYRRRGPVHQRTGALRLRDALREESDKLPAPLPSPVEHPVKLFLPAAGVRIQDHEIGAIPALGHV
jgi:hypothetical protein